MNSSVGLRIQRRRENPPSSLLEGSGLSRTNVIIQEKSKEIETVNR
jgi:hypothetical protein